MEKISRRNFLGVTSKGAAASIVAGTFAPTASSMIGLGGVASASAKVKPFTFAILTDAHLYDISNHRFDGFLEDAVAQVNALKPRPDLLIYAGDVGQAGKAAELEKGQKILSKLKMPMLIIPGEHDYYLDMGADWRKRFLPKSKQGVEAWSHDHNGVHIIGMNSILIADFWTGAGLTDLERMGRVEELECHKCGLWGVEEKQLAWLKKDVAKLSPDTPIIIFTHSPLWDYYPRWNFQTKDSAEIRQILAGFDKVTSIHGHVHQIVYNNFGNMTSAGLMSTSWPWPYPPVELTYPHIKMQRQNPGDFKDGMGSSSVAVGADFDNTMNYHAFSADLLPANVAAGIPI
ncbi:metallophosphoesterase [Beggiatoa alba]|nr:metallophosphoesterase [Beggiatoa alba]